MLELVLCTNIGKATTSAVLKEENQERNMRGLKKKHKMDGGWLARYSAALAAREAFFFCKPDTPSQSGTSLSHNYHNSFPLNFITQPIIRGECNRQQCNRHDRNHLQRFVFG